MRAAIAMLALAIPARAEAKYDACNGHGGFVLARTDPVPRNAKFWIGNVSDLYPGELRVHGPGVDRTIESYHHDDYADFGVLEPNATYKLSVPRWSDTVIGQITTTDEVDLTPPRTPWIRSLSIIHPTDSEHSDEPISERYWSPHPVANDLEIDLDRPDDAEFFDVTITTMGKADHYVVWRDDLRSLGRSACLGWRHLPANTNACVSIRAIDVAGNASGPTTSCTIVVDGPGDSAQVPIPRSMWKWPSPPTPPNPLDGLDWLQVVIALGGLIQIRLTQRTEPIASR